MNPRASAWQHREDILFSSAYKLSLFWDHDGEIVGRVLQRKESDRYHYLTPKVRLERKRLEGLCLSYNLQMAEGPLEIRTEGDQAILMLGGEMCGWSGRGLLAGAIVRLLGAVDGRPFISIEPRKRR